jgi:hypothetical protein
LYSANEDRAMGEENWEDWTYFFEDKDVRYRRKKYLKFCLNCGKNEVIRGPRYKIWEVEGQALLVDASWEYECKVCKFPLYTSGNYQQLTKHFPIPFEQKIDGFKLAKTHKVRDKKQRKNDED